MGRDAQGNSLDWRGSMGRKSFLKGAAILAVAGIAVRLIGALYRIPLQHIVGLEGIALYQMAYPVYSLLLTLSTAGIPGAISKLVSERAVYGDWSGARRVFSISLGLLFTVGLVSAAAMAMGSGAVARFVAGNKIGPRAEPVMLAASPALLFVAVITAFRGYFQGLQHMTPTAVSQVLEQIIKIIPGFYIAARMCTLGVEYGAAGAMWGVALSEAVAMAYLAVTYWVRRRREPPITAKLPMEPPGRVAVKLTALALPMMAGAVFLPLAGLADAFIVVNRLTALGYGEGAIQSLYGLLSGNVNVLVNVPSVLSLSLSASLIPSVAESCERGDAAGLRRKCNAGLKATLLLALPAAAGMAVLAKPVLNLLFGGTLTAAELAAGAELLASSCAGIVFLSVVQTTNGLLQGMGRVYVPMVSLAVGAAVKIALNYLLVGMPEINIHGAPLGTVACYLVPAAINCIVLQRAGVLRLKGMLLRPALASALMCGGAWALNGWLQSFMPAEAACGVAVAVSVPLYALLSVLTGAIGREELMLLPKGDTISAHLKRRGLLKG